MVSEGLSAIRRRGTEARHRVGQGCEVTTAAPSMRPIRPDVPATLDDLVGAMLTKRPADRPDADGVYDALLPLVRSGSAIPSDDRDPRRPFLRPLAPAARTRATPPAIRPPRTELAPLTVDEALDIHERVAQLVGDAQLQQAIDVLDEAVDRAATSDPALHLEMSLRLATTLFVADEFTRAAAAFDAVLPRLEGGGDVALLHYYAGVSHAEVGDIEPAIEYLTAFLAEADRHDPLYRDATYQLGMMLPTVGRADEGLRYLNRLRPMLAAEFGSESAHVASLDRRIAQAPEQSDQSFLTPEQRPARA